MMRNAALLVAALFALGGYIRTALTDEADRRLMPQMLIAFILAIGLIQ